MRGVIGAILLSPAVIAAAATAAPAENITAIRTEAGLQVQTPKGVLSIEPWSSAIVHVRFARSAGWSNPYNSWVVGKPTTTPWTMQENAEAWLVKTGGVQVSVRKSDGSLSFLDPQGGVLLAEGWGTRQIPAQGSGAITQSFDTVTRLYGLGQHQNGMLNYAGATVHLQQANRDVAVPMMVSPRGFGLLWNNASVTDVDVGQPAVAPLRIRSEQGEAIDYDFIYGPELDQVIAGYRALTGDAPLMPRWSWGLWQSRERYETQAQLLDVAARYRAMGAPLDAVVQDWQYWRAGQWGSHQFDPVRYPDPKAMVTTLHAQHVHAPISVWARQQPLTG